MAPKLLLSKLHFISEIDTSQSLICSQMAYTAESREQTIKNIRRNLQLFGHVHTVPARVGRKQSIISPMPEVLGDHLLENPGLSLYWCGFHTLQNSQYQEGSCAKADLRG